MRIMTTNIWGDYFGNPVGVRQKNIFEVYKKYNPDVIGFQEINESWYKSELINQWLNDKYYLVGTELDNNINYVPLAFNKKYKLLAKGYEKLCDTPDPSKAITWAVLCDEVANELFGVCNTHFWWMQGKGEYDTIRAKNAEQLSEIMKYIAERFKCPVFAFGDMNCNRSSQVFSVVYGVNGIRHLFDIAAVKDDICSLHGDPVADENGMYHGKASVLDQNASIDHIIALGEGFEVLSYRVITDQFALDATDHSPVFADIKFK